MKITHSAIRDYDQFSRGIENGKKIQNESAKSVVDHVHERVAIGNDMDTKVDATSKDAAIRDY